MHSFQSPSATAHTTRYTRGLKLLTVQNLGSQPTVDQIDQIRRSWRDAHMQPADARYIARKPHPTVCSAWSDEELYGCVLHFKNMAPRILGQSSHWDSVNQRANTALQQAAASHASRTSRVTSREEGVALSAPLEQDDVCDTLVRSLSLYMNYDDNPAFAGRFIAADDHFATQAVACVPLAGIAVALEGCSRIVHVSVKRNHSFTGDIVTFREVEAGDGFLLVSFFKDSDYQTAIYSCKNGAVRMAAPELVIF